ncbi:MAG: RNA 2',3'-cyclic phosphodiesterase [Terriglobia bacterium]
MPRLFTAVTIPETVKSQLARVQRTLAEDLPAAKFVAPENIHVTLKFLGDAPPELIPKIKDRLTKKLADFEPFTIRPGGLGAFPGARYARTLWVGLDEGDRELKQLFKHVEKALLNLGFGREKRRFSGHLTLARLRQAQNIENAIARPEANVSCPDVSVDRVVLFESILEPGGPVYTSLFEQILSGQKDPENDGAP